MLSLKEIILTLNPILSLNGIILNLEIILSLNIAKRKRKLIL